MISTIIILFNYIVWLFTGYVPMKHLTESPMVCIPLTLLEVMVEIILISLRTDIKEYFSRWL